MKKKEEDEGRAVDANDPIKDEPCTKMTMRLRRNLSSSQFVSVHVSMCNKGGSLCKLLLSVVSREPVLEYVARNLSL